MSDEPLVKPETLLERYHFGDFTFNPANLPKGASLTKTDTSDAVVQLWHCFATSKTGLPEIVTVYFDNRHAAEAFQESYAAKPGKAMVYSMEQKELYDKMLAKMLAAVSEAFMGKTFSMTPGTGKTFN